MSKVKDLLEKEYMGMITSNFNGERLKLARRFNKLTLKELSEQIHVTKQMISKYEKNLSQPSGEIIFNLEKVLGFPRRFYFEGDFDFGKIGNTYFRSLSKATKKDIEAQKIRIDFLSVVYKFIEEYIELPEANFPRLNNDNLDRRSIEELAGQVREYWNLGNEPIRNMVELLEIKGLVVSTSKMNLEVIDAYTQVREIDGKDIYFVILGNDKGSRFRRQFDAAHELAHILLHEGYLDVTTLSKEEEREIENQANDFASAFLLPRDSFGKDVSMMPTNLNHYLFLKKKWHVSVGAMIRRAFNLGAITNSQYTTLQRKISQNGWRKEEPLDNNSEPTSPVLLSNSFKLLLEKGVFDTYSLLEELSNAYKLTIREDILEDLVGLEKFTLSRYRKNRDNVILELKKKQY
jgi:Zn-dependent peptidase ImmA (M78 family)/DNA-binding XRE family transcriptional regulator